MPVPSIRCSRHIFAGKCLSCLHRTLFHPKLSWPLGHDDSVDVDEVQQPYDTYQEGYYHQYPDIALVAILIVLVSFRGLYRNINLSKANTDSVLSHKCSICCGGVLLNTFIQQCNVCIRCHQHGVYRVEKRNSSSSSDINISGIHDVLVSGSSTTPIIVNLFPFVFWK